MARPRELARTAAAWGEERRALLDEVKRLLAPGKTLQDTWPIARLPASKRRLAFKMQHQYRAYLRPVRILDRQEAERQLVEELPEERREWAREALAAVRARYGNLNTAVRWDWEGVHAEQLRRRFRELVEGRPRDAYSPEEAERRLVQVARAPAHPVRFKPGALTLVAAWCKSMALSGNSASETVRLLHHAWTLWRYARGRDPRTLLEDTRLPCGLLRREDKLAVLDLLQEPQPFLAEGPVEPGQGYQEIFRSAQQLPENDVHLLRRVVVPLDGATDAFANPSKLPFVPAEDLLGIRGHSVELSREERDTLRDAPSFQDLPRALRYRCLAAMPITYKSRTPRYAEVDRGNPQFRRKVVDYTERVAGIPSDMLVFADETSLFKDAFLTKGWGPIGAPSEVLVPKTPGARTAIWAAVSGGDYHAVVMPPVSRRIAAAYRGAATSNLEGLMRSRAHSRWMMPLNAYLALTEGVPLDQHAAKLWPPRGRRREGLGLCELVFVAFFSGPQWPEFRRTAVDHPVHLLPYEVDILELTEGVGSAPLRDRLRDLLTSFAQVYGWRSSVQALLHVALADYLVREKVSHHNVFRPEPGKSLLLGSGRLGMRNGTLDAGALSRDLANTARLFTEEDEDEDELDDAEGEEDDLPGESPEAAEALLRIAGRVYQQAAMNAVEFAKLLLSGRDHTSTLKGSRQGDVWDARGALVGSQSAEFALPFGRPGDAREPLHDLVPALLAEVGVDVQAESLNRNMDLSGLHNNPWKRAVLCLYVLASSTNRTIHSLTNLPEEMVDEAELKRRFPMYADGGLLRILKQTAGRRVLLPPFALAKPNRERRRGVADAETDAMPSSRHLFREFLRSLPPALLKERTVVLDNAAFHGGLRKKEVADVQKACMEKRAGRSFCYTGQDIKADLSEEAFELRQMGAGIGIPPLSRVNYRDDWAPPPATVRPALLFLPPYCPQLNPIETVFAFVKQSARRRIDKAPLRTREELSRAVLSAFEELRARGMLSRYFRFAGYGYEKKDGTVVHSAISAEDFLARSGIIGWVLGSLKNKTTHHPDAVPRMEAPPPQAPPAPAAIAGEEKTVRKVVLDAIDPRNDPNGPPKQLEPDTRKVLAAAYGYYDRPQAEEGPAFETGETIKRTEVKVTAQRRDARTERQNIGAGHVFG